MNSSKQQAVSNLRAEYKDKSAKTISWLKNTPEWQAAKKEMNFEDYEFIAPHMGYLKQMIRLNISSFSKAPLLLLTNLRLLMVTSIHGSKVRHLCENGIGILAIEKKSRRAVAYACNIDICDAFYVAASRTSFTSLPGADVGYLREIFGALNKKVQPMMPAFNDQMWNSEEELRQLWGLYTNYTIVFVSPHMGGSGMVPALVTFSMIVLVKIGYQCIYITLGHRKTVNMTYAQKDGEIIASVDVLNFKFKDGNSVQKLLKKHRKTYQFDDAYMRRLRESLVLKMNRCRKFAKWETYLAENLNMLKMYRAMKNQAKKKSNKRSKL